MHVNEDYDVDEETDHPRLLAWQTLPATPPLKALCLEIKRDNDCWGKHKNMKMFVAFVVSLRMMATSYDEYAAGEDASAKDHESEACLALLCSPSSEQWWQPGRRQCHPRQPCRQQHQ